MKTPRKMSGDWQTCLTKFPSSFNIRMTKSISVELSFRSGQFSTGLESLNPKTGDSKRKSCSVGNCAWVKLFWQLRHGSVFVEMGLKTSFPGLTKPCRCSIIFSASYGWDKLRSFPMVSGCGIHNELRHIISK